MKAKKKEETETFATKVHGVRFKSLLNDIFIRNKTLLKSVYSHGEFEKRIDMAAEVVVIHSINKVIVLLSHRTTFPLPLCLRFKNEGKNSNM